MGEPAQQIDFRRVPHSAARWVLAGAVFLTAIGGCAHGHGESDVLSGGGAALASTDLAGLGVSCTDAGLSPVPQSSASGPVPRPLPTDFRPVSASRCEFGVALVPGDGEWQTRDEQRADSGLDALAAALRQPSQGKAAGACAAIGMVPVVITLTDARGRKVVPALPHEACGTPLPSVVRAIRELPWRSVRTTKVHQTRSQLEIDSGCSGKYKPMIAIEAEEDSARSPNAAASAPGRPAALEVCRYRLDPSETISGSDPTVKFHLGALSSAAMLSGGTLERFLAAVHSAPPVTARCGRPQAPFAVVFAKDGAGPYLTVELGGCFRVDDGNGPLRQLDAGTVALLTT